MGQEPSLTRGEKHRFQRFLKSMEGDDVNERDGNELLDARDRKKAGKRPQHAIKHDGWTDAVEASLKNG